MTNEVEQASKTATDVADRLFTYGEQLAEKLNELGQQYGPQVVDLAMNVYRIQAAQELVLAFFCLLYMIAYLTCICRFLPRVVHWVEDKDTEGGAFLTVAVTVVGGFGAVASLFVIPALVNVWNWIGLWHPEVLMAKQVLGL